MIMKMFVSNVKKSFVRVVCIGQHRDVCFRTDVSIMIDYESLILDDEQDEEWVRKWEVFLDY